jgi:predicted nucleic acid-binding protein
LIVVDASVALKWALNEPDSAVAANLLNGGHEPHAPDLLRVEGAGAITRAIRNGRLSAGTATRLVDAWLRGLGRNAVKIYPNEPDLRRAAEISCALLHPVPDCLYLALAERLGAELVTADATFVGRAVSVWPRVRLLGA